MLEVCRTIGLCIAYVAMRLFLPRFFNISREAHIDKRALGSMLLIVTASAIGYALSYAIPDPWWGNRVLHVVGGGITVTLACFLAARESMPQMRRRRFFMVAIIAVTGLGVANEMAEFALQLLTGVIYAPGPKDTWWDLASNTAGMILSLPVFFYLHKKTG
ncbi:hypothetical protein HYT05_02290 [Candidatus Kaiserbacteria bacterium]|nr:hypothetical protein [Candidatus Kaiserbacteria bacterium]